MSRTPQGARSAAIGVILAAAVWLPQPSMAQSELEVTFDSPTADRWLYVFNSTPGGRATIPTFGAFNTFHDVRGGQFLLGYDTSAEIQTGLGRKGYTISSATLTVMISSDETFLLDSSLDAYDTYLAEGPADSDPGRPVILSPMGFRDGYTGATYGDDGPYSTAADPDLRAAHVASIDASGDLIDISNNVLEEYDPIPFAVGQVADVDQGDPVPTGSIMSFEIDLSDPSTHCYLADGLDVGYLSLGVSSLQGAEQPDGEGLTGGPNYPDFYASENIAVSLGLAQAASLELSVIEHTEPPQAGDADRDGNVTLTDFQEVLVQFGQCHCCSADFNNDGFVNVNDFMVLLINYGCCR